jgi:hypothetical protein
MPERAFLVIETKIPTQGQKKALNGAPGKHPSAAGKPQIPRLRGDAAPLGMTILEVETMRSAKQKQDAHLLVPQVRVLPLDANLGLEGPNTNLRLAQKKGEPFGKLRAGSGAPAIPLGHRRSSLQ